jgi:DNA-binding NtrC family response regulator
MLTPELVDVDDIILATRHPLPVLITAPSTDSAATLAHRIHGLSCGSGAPLVTFRASGFFGQQAPFAAQWSGLSRAAYGGSVLLTAIDEMSTAAQIRLTETLVQLAPARPPLVPRLIVATTVPLLERVMAGEFSEDLFYRLNVIHLPVSGQWPVVSCQ